MKKTRAIYLTLAFFLAVVGCAGGGQVSEGVPSRKEMSIGCEKRVEGVSAADAKTFICCNKDNIAYFKKKYELPNSGIYVCLENIKKPSDDHRKNVTVTCQDPVRVTNDEASAFICCSKDDIAYYKQHEGEPSMKKALKDPEWVHICISNIQISA